MSDLLQFDAATHTYRLCGMVVPSVTRILAPLVDLSGIRPEVLEAKRDLGSRVHYACQLSDEDDLDEDSVEADVEPYLAAWRRFLRESGAKVLANEQKVGDPMLMVAGTLDNILLMSGTKWVVDKKTSFATPISAGPQTAAYQRLNGDNSVTHRGVLRLRPDGTYRFDPRNGPDDWSAFMACLSIYRFKEKNRDH